ncbi:glycosyltransferase [Litorimonas haliclonae]|uniref:glycosyltransferase n=1 Tax=Litorimonas haliclonae TaxID=2081977 RepID=UPI0039EE730B
MANSVVSSKEGSEPVDSNGSQITEQGNTQANAKVLADFLRSTRGLLSQNRFVTTDLTGIKSSELAIMVSETEAKLRDSVQVKTADVSIEYKLGKLILDALNRDIGIRDATRAIIRFFRNDYKSSRRESRLRRLGVITEGMSPAEIITVMRKYDMDVVKDGIARIKALRVSDPIEAGNYARLLKNENMGSHEKKFLAFSLYDGGDVTSSHNLLTSIENVRFNTNEAIRKNRIFSENEFLQRSVDGVVVAMVEQLRNSLSSRALSSEGDFRNVAYVAASSLPMNKVGYTTRTHQLVTSMDAAAKSAGGKLVVVTRPGFPFDRFDLQVGEISEELVSEVDSIRYHHLKSKTAMQDSLIEYAREAAFSLVEFFIENDVHAVTAASNHVNGMAAFIAARALGLPFTYEVRGLWEETTSAKRPGWEKTERYAVERALETYLIANADHTFFITRQVKEIFFPPNDKGAEPGTFSELAGGANAAGLAPNCAIINPELKDQLPQYSLESQEVLTLTYIGSLAEYEGLQLMLTALAGDDDLQRMFKLNIVGGGVYAKELRLLTKHLKLDEIVHFAGRVDPSVVPEWFNSADIVIVPRLPHRVCQLVSPLKPLEAMSSNRVCLASDVAPIADLIEDSKTGFLFEAGDAQSLTQTLKRIHASQDTFKEISSAAYDYVAENRDWDKVSVNIYNTNVEASKKAIARRKNKK